MSRLLLLLFLLLLGAAHGAELATPFKEEAYWATALRRAEQGRVHGFLNLELTDRYVTTHGLLIENQGVIFQPLVSLYSEVYVRPESFLSSVLVSAGGWTSLHSHPSGKKAGSWNEVDGFGGLTATFARDWKLSAYYSRYSSQTDSFPEAGEVALTLGYDDTGKLGRFALHPYATFTPQLERKSSVIFRADRSHRSYEFRFGIAPAYQCAAFPLKLELPAFVTVVPNNYYQRSTLEMRYVRYFGIRYPYEVYDGAGGGAGAGFASVALRVSVPLGFVPKAAGSWTAYAAVQYYRFFNAGLLDGNQALGADAKRERNLLQLHAGLSFLF